MAEHDRLDQWMAETASEIERDYRENHARATDPSRIQQVGHSAEQTWLRTLQKWLPPQYEFGVRKYILPEIDVESYEYRETDLIIFRPGYPRALRQREEVLASGVLAAFSVKLTLDPNGVKEAAQEASRIRRHTAQRLGDPRRELTQPFRFGILAHSSRFGSKPVSRLRDVLIREDLMYSRHPRESLDLVCVADLGVWSKGTQAWYPILDQANSSTQWCVGTTYFDHLTRLGNRTKEEMYGLPPSDLHPLPILLGCLYGFLAREDTLAEPFSSGLIASGKTGMASGRTRAWVPAEVYHEETLKQLPSRIVNGRDPNWSMMV